MEPGFGVWIFRNFFAYYFHGWGTLGQSDPFLQGRNFSNLVTKNARSEVKEIATGNFNLPIFFLLGQLLPSLIDRKSSNQGPNPTSSVYRVVSGPFSGGSLSDFNTAAVTAKNRNKRYVKRHFSVVVISRVASLAWVSCHPSPFYQDQKGCCLSQPRFGETEARIQQAEENLFGEGRARIVS